MQTDAHNDMGREERRALLEQRVAQPSHANCGAWRVN
jgi:hypothetical protein